MIQIAIVEDDPGERARIRACLDFFTETENVSLHVTEFPAGEAFLGNYRPEFDIVLMDIQMPGMDGMETARALRRMDPAVKKKAPPVDDAMRVFFLQPPSARRKQTE